MPPSVLQAKPEEMDAAEKRERYTVSIVGCGQIGVLHACLFAEAGFKVICVDTNQTIVNHLSKGKAPLLRQELESKLKTHVKTGRLTATNDLKNAVSQSDVVIITISAKINEKKKADCSNVESACKQVGLGLRRGSLVIVVSAVGFGFMEGTIKEILENSSGLKAGADFGLAYSPIRVLKGETLELLANNKRIVAALEKNSLSSASNILETIAKKGVKKAVNVKTAELAELFETVQRDVNLALANELAIFCEKAGVDYLEIFRLLNGSACDMVSLPKLAEENTRKETHLLLEDAENLNVKLRIPTIAREINEEIIKHTVNLTKSALRDCGKTLRRARIALLGIAQTSNMKSPTKNAAKELAEMLDARGAKVSLHDPYLSENEIAEISYPLKKSLNEAVECADCIILLTEHDQFKRLNLKKLKVMMKMPAAIVDLEGMVEPDKVEEEGFIYRGLGRGVWKK